MTKIFDSSGYVEGNTKHHYGVTIDLNNPTTGVVSNNDIPWLHEMFDDAIDLAWEEHKVECNKDQHDECGYEGYGTMLIGAWQAIDLKPLSKFERIKVEKAALFKVGDTAFALWFDADGKRILADVGDDSNSPKKPADLKEQFSAIVGETTTQVVWSTTVRRVHAMCSPCYPGQADVKPPHETFKVGDIVRHTKGSKAVANGYILYAQKAMDMVVLREAERANTAAEWKLCVTYVDTPGDKEGIDIEIDQLELVDGYLAYDLPSDYYKE